MGGNVVGRDRVRDGSGGSGEWDWICGVEVIGGEHGETRQHGGNKREHKWKWK